MPIKSPKWMKIACMVVLVLFILIPLVLGFIALLASVKGVGTSHGEIPQTSVNTLSYNAKVPVGVLPVCDDPDLNVYNINSYLTVMSL